MKFAIRDDDVCFLTDPDRVRLVYENIWGWVPITLAVVPFVSPNADVVYDTEVLDSVQPIGDNTGLVKDLQARLHRGEADLALHGYHHDTPEGRPEFVTGSNLEEKVRRGKNHLEETFEREVSVFVPPHGRLSRAGVTAIEKAGLDIAREYGTRPREFQPNLGWLRGFSTVLYHHITSGRSYRLTYPINFGGHQALFCYRLNRYTDMQSLKDAFDYAASRDGVFCLSVHAGRLNETGQRKLKQAVEYARAAGAEPAAVSELLP